MNDRLKTIVDLENYPIHDLSSSKIQKLIKKTNAMKHNDRINKLRNKAISRGFNFDE